MIEMMRMTNQRVGTNGYWYSEYHLNQNDAFDGTVFVFRTKKLLPAAITVSVIGIDMGDEDVLAQIGGNTYYDVNKAAASAKILATLTFKFDTYLENRVTLTPKMTIQAQTLPEVFPCRIGFLFQNSSFELTEAWATRSHHPKSA